MRWIAISMLLCTISIPCGAADGEKISLAAAAEAAMQQSKLTLPGGQPFHLKAKIFEKDQPGSDYTGTLEIYWVSPSKWKRIVTSPDFSQTLVMNQEKVSETDQGDYFPFWLNSYVTAALDPLPMLEALKHTESQITKPHGGAKSTTCADIHARVDRWVICFEGEHGLLSSVFTKGYAAEFYDYKKFGDKWVARLISSDPEPGTKIQLQVTELTSFNQLDDPMFNVQESTPAAARIRSLRIDEDTFRKLVVGSTEIEWPPTGGGLATGGCAVYVSADRAGHVREAWPEGCDNTGLQDPLREAVKKWQLKPAISNGDPVQVEALLGFTFHTTVNPSPLPELSDAEVRKLATSIVEPVFPSGTAPKGTPLTVRISVDETGKLAGIENDHHLGTDAVMAIYRAVSRWGFHPYLQDGKPSYFHGELIFRVQ